VVQRVSTVAFEGIEARSVDAPVEVAPGSPAFACAERQWQNRETRLAAAAEVSAVLCGCPLLIYRRVRFIFTDLSRPAECVFLTVAGRTTTRRDHR
jgi:hypothetical protein